MITLHKFLHVFSKYLRTGSIFYHRIESEKDLSSFRSLNPGWLSQKKLQSSNKHTKDRNPQKVRGVLHQLGWKIFESSDAVFILYSFCCKHPNNCVSIRALWAFCQCMEKQCRLTSVLENGIDGFAKYCLGHFVCFCRNLHRRKSLGEKNNQTQKNYIKQTKKAKHNSVSRVSLHL